MRSRVKTWRVPWAALPLLLSLSLHCLTLWFFLQEEKPEKVAVETPPIELSQIPKAWLSKPAPAPSLDKQIVESEDAGNRKLDPNAKLLSDKTQMAQVETRAKNVEVFRKGLGEGEKNDGGSKVPDTLGLGATKKDWRALSLKDLGVGKGGGNSATDDYLRGISEGNQTILSTREFKFFSYYQRIKDLLRQYWRPNIERQVARVFGKGKTITEDELVTKLLVLLDDQGSLRKISRVGSSGIDEVDDAAVQAFQQAAPFPNPPKGIIDSDGFVRIRWDFILRTDAGPRIQFRTVGSAAPQ